MKSKLNRMASVKNLSPWTCPNCGKKFTGWSCPKCGYGDF